MKYGRFSKIAFETLNMLTKTLYRQQSIIHRKDEKQLTEEKAILKNGVNIAKHTIS